MGYFVGHIYEQEGSVSDNFLIRRKNFHGSNLIAMTENEEPAAIIKVTSNMSAQKARMDLNKKSVPRKKTPGA